MTPNLTSCDLTRCDLTAKLGPLTLANPIITASGTFGYGREMAQWGDLSRLGGIIPKTITVTPRPGNAVPRTCETTAGLLNAIGLDNDGLDEFLCGKLPFLAAAGAPVIVSIAAKTSDECILLAERLSAAAGVAALELNISCPNVSGGVDFGTDPHLCERMVRCLREHTTLPLAVKLSPNVTRIADIALAAEAAGADIITAINTLYGLAVDWRRGVSRVANGYAGYSGPAIKPVALRCVSQIFRAVKIPIIGVGGITCLDDVMEFLVAGACAVEIGTASFFQPRLVFELVEELPKLMAKEGIASLSDLVGTLKL